MKSESAIKRRLDSLRSSGAVLRRAVDHEPLGQDVSAMLWLTVAPRALAEVGRSWNADDTQVNWEADACNALWMAGRLTETVVTGRVERATVVATTTA
ncbi:hypothetical protein [Streptomyces sp. NPDC051677]|uniref:hypothetical protein n=1 Tax=Streptomyces sp. NPDC051677 TaxID=3365669 RepID=UPI0037D40F26